MGTSPPPPSPTHTHTHPSPPGKRWKPQGRTFRRQIKIKPSKWDSQHSQGCEPTSRCRQAALHSPPQSVHIASVGAQLSLIFEFFIFILVFLKNKQTSNTEAAKLDVQSGEGSLHSSVDFRCQLHVCSSLTEAGQRPISLWQSLRSPESVGEGLLWHYIQRCGETEGIVTTMNVKTHVSVRFQK